MEPLYQRKTKKSNVAKLMKMNRLQSSLLSQVAPQILCFSHRP
ncbi:unnamed protein product [Amoebophrya sp. A120]|nr:unnamed protein product [Amoebophrya sp. A120]|eukprot:GSA120T00007878001.1